MHKCNRDDCPPNVIKGPKIKCSKCKNECYLKCFGFDKADKIDGNETLKISLSNGASAYVYLTQLSLVCCSDTVPVADQKLFMPKMNKQRAQSKSRQTNESTESKIRNELTTIKNMLNSIRNSTDTNAADLLEIKSNTSEIIETVKQQSKPNNLEIRQKSTPSFSEMLKTNVQTPKPLKRLRRQLTETPNDKEMKKLPTPKKGTRDVTIGKPIAPRKMKPTFDKAVWVSGLHNETTVDEMINFVLSNTELNEKDQFECHKLVKKEADISKLSFVSFKISVNNEHFDMLMDPDTWPRSVSVREFRLKTTLGDFMPILNPQVNRESQKEKKLRLGEKNQTPSMNQSNNERMDMDVIEIEHDQ